MILSRRVQRRLIELAHWFDRRWPRREKLPASLTSHKWLAYIHSAANAAQILSPQAKIFLPLLSRSLRRCRDFPKELIWLLLRSTRFPADLLSVSLQLTLFPVDLFLPARCRWRHWGY